MNTKPKVSVIIPSYNHEKYIKKCVDSILNQTYKDFELIVIDDGSTDKSVEILEKYGERIRFIRKKNSGLNSSLNLGISLARGDYISILGSDDYWFENTLEREVFILDSNYDVGVVYSDEYFIDENDRITGRVGKGINRKSGMITPDLFMGNFISATMVMYRKKCFDKVGMFDENLLITSDYDMSLRLSMHYKFYYNNEVLGCYRIHKKSTSQKKQVKKLSEELELIDRFVNNNHLYIQEHNIPYKKRKSEVYIDLALQYALQGSLFKAIENFFNSLKENDFKYSFTYLVKRVSNKAVHSMQSVKERCRSKIDDAY